MSVTKVITLDNGIQTEVVPATTSAGAGSAGQLVALNASGLVDSTMLPSSGGSGSSGPSMVVPRNRNWHIAIANPENNTFDCLGVYSYFGSSDLISNASIDPAGYTSMGITTGTTANTQVGWTQGKDVIFNNASFRLIYGLTTTANVVNRLGLSTYANIGMADSGSLAGSGIDFIGFSYASTRDTTGNWQAVISASSAGTEQLVDTGVAVNTTQLQMFDVIHVSGVPQFYIDGVQVAASISTTTLPSPSTPVGLVAVHKNLTATEVIANMHQWYFGCN